MYIPQISTLDIGNRIFPIHSVYQNDDASLGLTVRQKMRVNRDMPNCDDRKRRKRVNQQK